MPRGPQRGLAGWGLIERAPSLAIQLFFFAHQTYGTLLGSLLWALDGGSNDDQLEHSFNEQRLIYLSFLNWHRLHLPYLNTIVIRRHICLDIGIKVLRSIVI